VVVMAVWVENAYDLAKYFHNMTLLRGLTDGMFFFMWPILLWRWYQKSN
jgi:hypothetical protein